MGARFGWSAIFGIAAVSATLTALASHASTLVDLFSSLRPSTILRADLSHHERYDRLVIELSRGAELVQRPATEQHDLRVDLGARPNRVWEELTTAYPRIGLLQLAPTEAGARLLSPMRDRRLRLFQLEDPPRLVVDFADRDEIVLSEPRGRAAVPVQLDPPPLATPPEGRAHAADDPETGSSSPSGSRAVFSSPSAEALHEAAVPQPGGGPDQDPQQPIALYLDPVAGSASEAGAPASDVARLTDPGSARAAAAPPRARWLIGVPVLGLLLAFLAVGASRCLRAWRRVWRAFDRTPWHELAIAPAEPRGAVPMPLARGAWRTPIATRAATAGRSLPLSLASAPVPITRSLPIEDQVDQLRHEVRQLRAGLSRLTRQEPGGA